MSEDRPLAGRRLLVTRRGEQSSSLVAELTALGAEVAQVPAIAIGPPEDLAPLNGALAKIDRYDWVVFTSANAVRAIADRLQALHRQWPGQAPRLGAVGPATVLAIAERLGVAHVDLTPDSEYRAEGLLAAFAAMGAVRGQRILLPLGDRARDVLARGLMEQGAHVDAIVAYRTVAPPDLADRLSAALAARIDLGLFASPSAVESFVAAAGDRAMHFPAAVMGPITERAARAAGLDVRAVAQPSTVAGLVAAALLCLTRTAR